MIIDCISDLHGRYPKLEGGDLLIVAGDLTARDTNEEYHMFHDWAVGLDYFAVVVIGGNHDNRLQANRHIFDSEDSIIVYLEDESFEYMDINIWGSPWTKTFEGMNPHCKAFTKDTEKELADKFKSIPDDVDILITHSPPWGVLDKTTDGDHVGSKALASQVGNMKNPPKLWVWGHIHESYGIDSIVRGKPCKMVNASHVNERYQPVNKPIRIEL